MVVLSSFRCKKVKLSKILVGLLVTAFVVQLYIGYMFLGINRRINFNDRYSKLTPEEREKRLAIAKLWEEKDALYCKACSEENSLNDAERIEADRQAYEDLVSHLPSGATCENLTAVALSAYTRAKSTQCKRNIKLLACIHQHNPEKLYPKSLPSYCPLRGSGRGDYIGCYKDIVNNRDLNSATKKIEDNTPENCIALCFLSGYNYAALQYSNECYCGNAYGVHGESQSCNQTCPGNPSQICGGIEANSIYKTGFGVRPHSEEVSFQAPLVLNSDTYGTVRILFMLTVNGRAVRQVKRLFKSIYHINHYYYIHVDARQEYLYREMIELSKQYHNVRVTPRRYATIWGGASLLQMLLSTMRESLNMDDWKWDFYLNLSESDYPLKTVEELTAFLSANRDKNFLKSHGQDTPKFVRNQGLLRLFYECEFRLWRIDERQLPKDIRVDGGSDWICLNRKFIKYVTTTQDDLVTGLNQYFKYALLPAEAYFHTVLQNSDQCQTFIDNNLHKTNWNRKRGCLCQYKHIVDWCGCSPIDYTLGDTEKLKKAVGSNIFFARKFEAVISNSIINWLDQWVNGEYIPDLPALNQYWENIYHFKDTPTTKTDSYYGHYMAFSRNILSQLSKVASGSPACLTSLTSVTHVNIFTKMDNLDSLLVTFTTSGSGVTQTWEGRIKQKQNIDFKNSHGPITRLKNLQVGSSFDMKERTFRDYGQLISSTHSGPNITIMHHWDAGVEFNITLTLINPIGLVKAYNHVTIPRGSENMAITQLTIDPPRIPGVWYVKILYENKICVSRSFLVFPDLYTNRGLHNDHPTYSSDHISDVSLEGLQILLAQLPEGGKTFPNISSAYETLKGKAMLSLFDDLSAKFYEPKGVCAVIDSGCSVVPLCNQTTWSSYSSDPKSELNLINPRNGKFYRPSVG